MNVDVTKRIAQYMKDSQIDLEQVAKDTSISQSKLKVGTAQRLSSEEFLILCQYLQINPKLL